MKQPTKEQLLGWLEWIRTHAHQCGFDPIPNYHKDYYLGYCEHVLPLVESGEIFEPKRARMGWSPYNTRSPWAILGVVEEMYQIVKFNGSSSLSKMYRSDGGKETEERGEDSCVYNAKWARPYSVQSKRGSTSWDGLLTVYTDWLNYPETLDRFCVSNHDIHWSFMVDYPKFKELVKGNYRLHHGNDRDYYLVPITDLKNAAGLRFMSF